MRADARDLDRICKLYGWQQAYEGLVMSEQAEGPEAPERALP